MSFKKWVKSIQTAGYNGARTVFSFTNKTLVKKVLRLCFCMNFSLIFEFYLFVLNSIACWTMKSTTFLNILTLCTKQKEITWVKTWDFAPIYVFLWCYQKIWKIALFTNKKTYLQIPNSFDFFFFLSFFLSFSRKKKKWATIGQCSLLRHLTKGAPSRKEMRPATLLGGGPANFQEFYLWWGCRARNAENRTNSHCLERLLDQKYV